MTSLHDELAEAKKFISQASQPGIKALLQEYCLNIEETLNKEKNRFQPLNNSNNNNNNNNNTNTGDSSSSNSAAGGASSSASNTNTTPPVNNTVNPNCIKQVSITSYSWDESDSEVKLYLKLPTITKKQPIEKIIFSINTNADEKILKIAFAVFLASNDDKNIINAGELHSFVAQPLKHELETLYGMYELPKIHQNSNSATDGNNDDNNSQVIFSTPNASFVYPGERQTPSGGSLRYCRLKVKANGDVVVGIQKVMPGVWADLIDKDDFNKPLAFGSTGGKSRNDPGVQQTASLVSLMQQLYKDGDDEMKKTIAMAWEESRHNPIPRGGDDNDALQ